MTPDVCTFRSKWPPYAEILDNTVLKRITINVRQCRLGKRPLIYQFPPNEQIQHEWHSLFSHFGPFTTRAIRKSYTSYYTNKSLLNREFANFLLANLDVLATARNSNPTTSNNDGCETKRNKSSVFSRPPRHGTDSKMKKNERLSDEIRGINK